MREPMQQRKIGSLKLELKRKITHEKKKILCDLKN